MGRDNTKYRVFAHNLMAHKNYTGTIVPREIKRNCIKIISNLGKGNFGTVDKGLLHEVQLGIPEYLVAVKQLLSKRTEDRATLLEEAATMAQFQHKHLVALIGVVTAGDPLMVREWRSIF